MEDRRGEGWLRGAHAKQGVMGRLGVVLFRWRRELPEAGEAQKDQAMERTKVAVRDEPQDREGADLGPVCVTSGPD